MTRQKSAWFAMYSDDWTGGTRAMSLAARGAFIDLLCHQFAFGSIPADDRKISRLIGAFEDEWAAIKSEVLPKFEARDEGQALVNLRMEKEREERESIRQKRILAGAKGGSAPSKPQAKGKQVLSKCLSKPEAKGKQVLSKCLSKPEAKATILLEASTSTSSSLKERERDSEIDPSDIDRIRGAYPKATHQREAEEAILDSIRLGADPEDICRRTKAIAAKLAKWPCGGRGRYVPTPATFFRRERWREDAAEWDRSAANGDKPAELGWTPERIAAWRKLHPKAKTINGGPPRPWNHVAPEERQCIDSGVFSDSEGGDSGAVAKRLRIEK